MRRWGLADLIPLAELAVSELVTNAVRYAQGTIGLRLVFEERPLHRGASTTPPPCQGCGTPMRTTSAAAACSREPGRAPLGHPPRRAGKVVWCELSVPPTARASQDRPERPFKCRLPAQATSATPATGRHHPPAAPPPAEATPAADSAAAGAAAATCACGAGGGRCQSPQVRPQPNPGAAGWPPWQLRRRSGPAEPHLAGRTPQTAVQNATKRRSRNVFSTRLVYASIREIMIVRGSCLVRGRSWGGIEQYEH